ncbi:hypothetical protein ACFYMW_01340 [Streptomyces sp. NPDC006692]|uniref:hypothetical protein n=1 Tax=unclassified Streptomyces TaxID=2593676 RepID=UPI00368D94EB
MQRTARANADATGNIDWLASIGSTSVRADQHAARRPAPEKGGSAPAADVLTRQHTKKPL